MKTNACAIAVLGLSLATYTQGQGTFVLETATPGPEGDLGGFIISSSSFIGSRFHLDVPTSIGLVGGHFAGGQHGAGGTIFAAIAALSGPSAFPTGLPFASGEVLGHTLITISQPESAELLAPLPLDLEPGDYLLAFGSGLFGATGEGSLPAVNPTTKAPVFTGYNANNAVPFWVDVNLTALGDSNQTIRIVVEAVTEPPTIQSSPLTQTVEVGTPVDLSVRATGSKPLNYVWYFNNTNLIGYSTNHHLQLTNLQFSQSGAYTALVTNAFGAVTSSPAMLNVISAVKRRAVPIISVMGEAGSSLHVQYTDSPASPSSWQTLDTITLTLPPQYWFDLSTPLPPERFYRVWQAGTPAVLPSFNLASMAPAITVSGNIGDSVRVDYINAIGPTNAWVTLDTVTLTNTSQLYSDVTAPWPPKRLYRLVQIP